MPSDAYYRGKTVDGVLAELYDTAQPGSPVHEQQKMAIWVMVAKSLTDATNKLAEATTEASRQSDKLQRRIVALTVVLSVATVVAALATLVTAAQP